LTHETRRYCYNLIDLISEVGGFLAGVFLISETIVKQCAETKGYAIFASKAYIHGIDGEESKLQSNCFGFASNCSKKPEVISYSKMRRIPFEGCFCFMQTINSSLSCCKIRKQVAYLRTI